MHRLSTLVLAILCSGCTAAAQYRPWPEATLAQPTSMAVGFNQRSGSSYISPLTGQRRPGDNLEQQLISAIAGAQREVLVAVQELTLPALAEALIERHRAGVTVKLVLENAYSAPWSWQHPAGLEPHAQRRLRRLEKLGWPDAIALLESGGVPLLDDTADGSAGSGLMHHKFVVIDRQRVLTGSANFTSSGLHGDAGQTSSRGNVNHLLQLESPRLAKLFAEEFEQLWGDGPGGLRDSRFGLGKRSRSMQTVQLGEARIGVLFAPHRRHDHNHGLELIAKQLDQAKRSIDLALFVFSAQELADVLAAKHEQGVQIRVLVDPGFAHRSYSEWLDMHGLAMADHRCRIEAGNNPWPAPLQTLGTPRIPRGDKLHHKFAVIDNRKVIAGSFNWSPSAAHTNDETLLVIDSPTLASHFSREMDRLWQGAKVGISPRLHRKLIQSERRCGHTRQVNN
ncbi:phospholipase D-like domain-containing protein [Synechococcus sp. MIT S9452]|uniref:phospholipase D-like domain-containing protein n=1 Tax=Synechococcus sp. MIT S9452 TaxID=3082546 RepID=UPI0039A4F6A5